MARTRRARHTGPVATALEVGRARSDIDVMSRAGLPLSEFMHEAMASIARVVPFAGACVTTLDPATALVSSVRKVGEIAGHNDADVAWAQIEYGIEDPTTLIAMVEEGTAVLGVSDAFDGDIARSARMAEFMIPRFDYRDEARVVFMDRSGPWGAVSMLRGADEPRFGRDDLAFLREVAPAFTRGIRAGLLATTGARAAAEDRGPAVVIVDAQDHIVQTSPGATAYLALIADVPDPGDPLTMVQALVSGARRFARGETDRVPRVRVRAGDGMWLVMHASPLGGTPDRVGDVVVTIEQARPQEIIGIAADAFGLTPRERDVTAMVLRGADTKEIAAGMHVSPYTVQDHLKSIFEKARVTSRRELVAKVCFDQYVPRMGAEVGPTGWFLP